MINLLKALNPQRPGRRYMFIGLGLTGLVLIFVFQQFSYSSLLFEDLFGLSLVPHWKFALDKFIRFILNDLTVILVIYGLFYEKKYVDLALLVICFGFFVILLPYLFLATKYPDYNGPLYSHLHRLIMNPILLLLLIPVLLYQKLNPGK